MYRTICCITALFFLLVNGPTLAQGSVGGTIGKQDKSISGDGPVDSRATRAARGEDPSDGFALWAMCPHTWYLAVV